MSQIPRLLALDLDGTLLDSHGELSDGVCRAVGSAAERVQVVVCTGRRYRTSLSLLQALSCRGPAVTQDGTVTRDVLTGDALRRCTLPEDLCTEVMDLLRELCPPLVFVDDHHNGLDILSEPFDSLHEVQQGFMSMALDHTRFVDSLDRTIHEPVLMLSGMADRQSCNQMQQRIEQAFGARVVTHLVAHKRCPGYMLEVVSPNAGKWNALGWIAERNGIDTEEIVAIGDDENDISMLRNAGIGIAMGNATETVKDAADYLAPGNDEDGVVDAIRRFVLDV